MINLSNLFNRGQVIASIQEKDAPILKISKIFAHAYEGECDLFEQELESAPSRNIDVNQSLVTWIAYSRNSSSIHQMLRTLKNRNPEGFKTDVEQFKQLTLVDLLKTSSFLGKQYRIESGDPIFNIAFFIAGYLGDLDYLRKISQRNPNIPLLQWALCGAAMAGEREFIEHVLTQHKEQEEELLAPIKQHSLSNRSPLFCALDCEQKETLTFLFERQNFPKEMFFKAVELNRPDSLYILFEFLESRSHPIEQQLLQELLFTVVDSTIGKSKTTIVQTLLNKGADPLFTLKGENLKNLRHIKGYNALEIAIIHNIPVAWLLLEHCKGNPLLLTHTNQKFNYFGFKLIHLAVYVKGDLVTQQIFNRLIEFGASPSTQIEAPGELFDTYQPIHLAISEGRYNIAKSLITMHGVSPMTTLNSRPAFLFALEVSDIEMITLLFNHLNDQDRKMIFEFHFNQEIEARNADEEKYKLIAKQSVSLTRYTEKQISLLFPDLLVNYDKIVCALDQRHESSILYALGELNLSHLNLIKTLKLSLTPLYFDPSKTNQIKLELKNNHQKTCDDLNRKVSELLLQDPSNSEEADEPVPLSQLGKRTKRRRTPPLSPPEKSWEELLLENNAKSLTKKIDFELKQNPQFLLQYCTPSDQTLKILKAIAQDQNLKQQKRHLREWGEAILKQEGGSLAFWKAAQETFSEIFKPKNAPRKNRNTLIPEDLKLIEVFKLRALISENTPQAIQSLLKQFVSSEKFNWTETLYHLQNESKQNWKACKSTVLNEDLLNKCSEELSNSYDQMRKSYNLVLEKTSQAIQRFSDPKKLIEIALLEGSLSIDPTRILETVKERYEQVREQLLQEKMELEKTLTEEMSRLNTEFTQTISAMQHEKSESTLKLARDNYLTVPAPVEKFVEEKRKAKDTIEAIRQLWCERAEKLKQAQTVEQLKIVDSEYRKKLKQKTISETVTKTPESSAIQDLLNQQFSDQERIKELLNVVAVLQRSFEEVKQTAQAETDDRLSASLQFLMGQIKEQLSIFNPQTEYDQQIRKSFSKGTSPLRTIDGLIKNYKRMGYKELSREGGGSHRHFINLKMDKPFDYITIANHGTQSIKAEIQTGLQATLTYLKNRTNTD